MFLDDSTTEENKEKEGKKEKKFKDTRLDTTKGPDLFTGKYKQHIDKVREVYSETSKSLAIDEVGKKHSLRETLMPIGESHGIRSTPMKLEAEREDMLKEALKRGQLDDMHTERVKDSSKGVFGKHIDKIRAIYGQYRRELFSGFGSHAPTSKSKLKYYRSEK